MRRVQVSASGSVSRFGRLHHRGRNRKVAWLLFAVAPVAMAMSNKAAMGSTDTWAGTNDTEWGTVGNFTGGNSPPQAGDTLVFTTGTPLNSDDNLGNGFSIGAIQFNTGAGAYILTSDAGANDQSLALTGALTDNAANGPGTAQTINFAIAGTSTSSLVIGSDKSGGNNLTLGANDTFGALTVSSSATTAALATANVLNIGSTTLNVTGAVTVGAPGLAGPANAFTVFNVTGAGTWNVGGAGNNANFSVGASSGNNNNGNTVPTLDMSGLANFTFTTGTGTFGVGNAVTRPAATLKLANTTNTITAASFIVGNSNATGGDNNNNLGLANILDLGAGSNIIRANAISIGIWKATGVVQYLTMTGSTTITGEAGGTTSASITIANCIAGSAATVTSSLLLANNNASSATVQAAAVSIGTASGVTGSTSSTGLVTFDTGTFNATSLQLGVVSGTTNYNTVAGGATGTFVLGTNSSSTGVLNVSGAFTLVGNSDTPTTGALQGGTANGTFTINGGTANLNSNIAITTPSTTKGVTNATLNLNGGRLNMNGFAIGNAIPSPATGTVTINMPSGAQVATIQNLGLNGIFGTTGTGAGASGVVMGGTGTLVLAGTNTYTGPTTVNAGTLQIGTAALGGSIPSASTVTNNSILSFGGSVPINISNNISGTGTVSQNSTSTTTLSGASNYGGNTTINSGTLAVIGSLSGNVVVVGGALAGTGSVGNVTLNAGGAIHPGSSGADLNVGTIGISSLNTSGGDMRFDLGGASSDVINDSGAANFTGGTISLVLDSAPTVPSYTLLTAAGGITGTPTLATPSIGRTTFTLQTVGNSLKVNIGGGPATLIWGKLATGAGDGTTWDNLQTNQNWSNAGAPDTFYDADIVNFTDSNGGHNNVNITSQVSPGTLTFSNNTHSYVLSGTGGISGTTGLLVNGGGSVTLQTVNTYAGNTNVNSGTLVLSSGGSIASPNFNVGGGIVNINAAGSASSTNINVNSGSFNVNSGGSLTTSGVNVTVASGASMTVGAAGSIPTTTSFIDNGTVTFNTPTITVGTIGGTGIVSLNGAALTIAGGTASASLQDGASAGSLSVGPGTLILTGTNTYTGATTIPIGSTLQIGNGGASGSLSTSTAISDAGTLSYNLNVTPAPAIAPIVADSGSVIFNSPGTLNANISNITGAGSIQQTGAGTTAVTGSFAGFTGRFSVAGGTLQFNFPSPTTIPNPIGSTSSTGAGAINNVGKLTLSGTEALGTNIVTYNVTPVAGLMPSGVAADVEITGNITTTNTVGLIKTGTGTLALSGTVDNAALGVTVNGGTVLLNKQSLPNVHAVGGSGLNINNTGTVQFAVNMGPNQIYDSGGTVSINDGGTLDMNGQNQKINNLTMGSSTVGGTLTNSVAGTNAVITVGTAIGGTDDASLAAVPPSTVTTALGAFKLNGAGFVNAVAGSTIEIQANGVAAASSGTHVLTDNGPGTVFLTGAADNSSIGVAVTQGTLVLAKTSSSTAHAAAVVTGVSPGATLKLGGSGSDPVYGGGDQIYNGFQTGTTDAGVLNMNGTFDLNGFSESFDKLTGSGNVINSSGSGVTITLGTDNGVGPTTSDFTGVISGNIAISKFNFAAPTLVIPAIQLPVILSGANTYNGGTSIFFGTLQVGDQGVAGGNGGTGGTLGTGPVDDEDTLNFDRSDAGLVVANQISGPGLVNQIGTGTTTLSAANSYSGNTNVNAGTLTLADTGTIGTDSNHTVAVLQGAIANINGLLNANPVVSVKGTLNIGPADANNHTPGTTLLRTWSSLTLGVNTDNSGGVVTMATAADHTVLALSNGLTFGGSTGAWIGKLNMGGNTGLIVSNGSLSDVTSQLKQGFNAGAGYWNGTGGIVSSAAASDNRFLTTLGVGMGGNNLDGVGTSSSDVIVKYTYYGDADLNGVVNGADYQQIDLGFGTHATGWSNGDFNYDGVVNGSDFALIDNTFNQITARGASPLAIVADPASLVASPATTSAVPEPTTIGLVGIGAIGLLGRRRRRV